MIPSEVRIRAVIGGVEEEAKEVDDIWVKWIWDTWRGARESGRRTGSRSNSVHGVGRKKKMNKGAREAELELGDG